jgi:hypothetical protein
MFFRWITINPSCYARRYACHDFATNWIWLNLVFWELKFTPQEFNRVLAYDIYVQFYNTLQAFGKNLSASIFKVENEEKLP